MRMIQWISLIAAPLASLCTALFAQSDTAPLTTIPQVQALAPQQASRGVPVELHGVVTFVQTRDGSLFLQEDGAGIYVDFNHDIGLRQGDRVVVTGKTVSSFKTDIAADNVRVEEHGKLPVAHAAEFTDLIDSKLDSILVKVRGRIVSATYGAPAANTDLRFHLKVRNGVIEGDIAYPGNLTPQQLLDAEVEMTGVAGGAFDSKMQMGGVWLDIDSPDQIHVLHPPVHDPWSLPAVPLNEVIHAYRRGEESERVRVVGTLTYYEPESVAIIQRNGQAMLLSTGTTEPISTGTEVEATGFPEITDDSIWINHAQLRSLKRTSPVLPENVGWGPASQGKFAYSLISMEGKIVARVHDSRVDMFIVQTEDHLFSAALRHTSSDAGKAVATEQNLEVGSRVRVTGVCFMDPGNHWRNRLWFDLRMRSLDDITLLEPPSWWTVRRLSYVITILSAVILLAVIWAGLLDRRLRSQTEVLARQSQEDAMRERRRARLEEQRSRILELISSSEPLHEVLDEIELIVSTRLLGARCWIELAPRPGSEPAASSQVSPTQANSGVVSRELRSPEGASFGFLRTLPQPKASTPDEVEEAMTVGACLAELAIDTRRLYTDLRHRSEFDLLTDVPNRFSMERKLDQMMVASSSSHESFGLIYVDLDGFKEVNDQHGHRIGDIYLMEVTRRMKLQLRAHDFLARIGGDEFIALTPIVHGRSDAEEIAARLEHCFGEPFVIEGVQISGGASVGLAVYPEDGSTKEQLQRVADAAMYTHKEGKPRGRRGQSRIAI